MEIDQGRAALLEVIQAYSKFQLHDANEAETRKKVIDVMLERVLGWNPAEDISYEETVRPQNGTDKFADYSIRTATTGLVVEAKRVGRSFELPTNRKAAKLGGVLSEGEVGDAISQARDYAFNLSLQFAVATNGAAWIVFPAVRTDGVIESRINNGYRFSHSKSGRV
jgi:predicted type IV restriction endonuclease